MASPMPPEFGGDATPEQLASAQDAARDLRAAGDKLRVEAHRRAGQPLLPRAEALIAWLNHAADEATEIGPDRFAVAYARTVLRSGGA